MNITLHIGRLVLEGISLSPDDAPLLRAAVEAELTHLLASAGLGHALQSGGAWYSVRAAGIQPAPDGSSARLGQQIAGAVYSGIGT
jgi:hypothetical protein